MRLIDANRVLEDMENNMDQHTFEEWKEYIDSIPTIEAEPVRHGRWIEWYPQNHMILTGEEMLYRCSCCDAKYSDKENMHYCPYCGAKIDKEEE